VWASLSSSPGVYWFLDDQDTVLYVGKAKNLKNRIASYKQWESTTGKTRRLVFHATRLKHQILESEIEALLVEAELIRTHQPQYNILLKDDKTPLYVQITDEKFPQVLMIRKKEVEKKNLKGAVFGPFQSGYQLKEVLHLARKIFPYCTAARNPQYGTKLNSPCFDYHLDLCSGACIGQVSAEQYQETIEQLKLFLRGKKKDVVKAVEQDMKTASANEEYEYAAQLRDRIRSIKAVTQATYRLKPELQLPKLKESLRAEGLIYLRRLLSTHFSLPKTYPLTRIEGYDVSNIQGTNATVAQVTFINGLPAKDQYRLFNIRTIKTPNDFAMLQEAILRRQNHPEWGAPNLLVIDGGKGQLRAALKVWGWTTPIISIAKKPDRLIFPVFPDPTASKKAKSTKKAATVTKRKIVPVDEFSPNRDVSHLEYHELRLPDDHPTLKLIQQIRDESHRFSKFQHTRLRDKQMLE
jgi:excinuclease ABC subunit C